MKIKQFLLVAMASIAVAMCFCLAGCNTSSCKNVEVGDTITLGSYPQSFDGEIKPIEWQVIYEEEGRILAVSSLALDCIPYGLNDDVSWGVVNAMPYAQTWLINDFKDEAFSSDEKQLISDITILDEGQIELLLQDIQCKPSDYAVSKGAHVSEENGACLWWVKNAEGGSFWFVHPEFDTVQGGSSYHATYDIICIRPAIWISTES